MALQFLKGGARMLLDAVLPPQCLSCGALVSEPGALCPACWERIQFLAPPYCAACGLPFEIEMAEGALCGACLRQPPPFRRTRAVFLYDDHGRRLVLRYKHGDRTDMAPAFARWMARAGAELLAEAEVLVPVPLHWLRMFGRRYNQAALLANALGRTSGTPVAVDALARRRRTAPQGTKGRQERQRNVRGAFTVSRPQAVAGRNVLLIDDVITTGATVGECARVLLAGGARAVDVLALARVAPAGR